LGSCARPTCATPCRASRCRRSWLWASTTGSPRPRPGGRWP
jgi:hypothetical protein